MRSRNLIFWRMVIVLFLAGPQAMALTQFKDGQTHDINYEIADDVWVDYESPGMQTTVNWLDGGEMLPSYTLEAYEDSRINIFGGSIDYDFFAYDNTRLIISGGSIGDDLHIYDNTQVNMSGGHIMDDFTTYGSSHVIMSGGSIGYFLRANNNSQVKISGGTIADDLYSLDNTLVTLSGGSIGDELRADDNGIIKIQGSEFLLDGQPFDYGELTSILGGYFVNEPCRHLNGKLSNGGLIDNDFYIGHDAKIILIPEPATLLLLGFGCFPILSGLRRKR